MGTSPVELASERPASPSSRLPTSTLDPSPSRPLHTPCQTLAHPATPEPALQQRILQAPAAPGEAGARYRPSSLVSQPPPRSSHTPSAGDRHHTAAFDRLHGEDGAAWLLSERDGDYSPSLIRRDSSSKGLEKRPRTRERRHVGEAEGDFEDRAELDRRQWQIPHADGYPSCYYVDLSVFTCYPESNTTLVQDDYSLAIWNSAQPSFISRGYVDVYLYNADTQDVATSWRNESNAQGMVGIVPDDPWWPSGQTAQQWFGTNARNRSTPYFFVVVPAGNSLTGGEVHGPTFTAIQTAAPTSLSSALAALTTSSLSAVSSASLASVSSLSSLSASLSSASASSASRTDPSRTSSRAGSTGALQNASSSDPALPNYAIALIVVLGFLALLAGAIAAYCCLGRGRKRRRDEAAAAAGAGRGRGGSSGDFTDLGSAEPMLAGAGAGAAASASRGSRSSSRAAPPAGLLAGAAGTGAGAGAGKDAEKDDDKMLSQSDAARMAEAFRAALRKPEYAPAVTAIDTAGPSVAVGPGAGPSPVGAPEGTASSGSGATGEGEGVGVGRGIMEEELRSEGKSMRSVEGGGKRWGRAGGAGAAGDAGEV